METMTINMTPEMLAVVPMVVAIVQILKQIEVVSKIKQWLPFVSIGVAMGLCYLTNIPNPVVSAIIIGLVSSGGYDLFKFKKPS